MFKPQILQTVVGTSDCLGKASKRNTSEIKYHKLAISEKPYYATTVGPVISSMTPSSEQPASTGCLRGLAKLSAWIGSASDTHLVSVSWGWLMVGFIIITNHILTYIYSSSRLCDCWIHEQVVPTSKTGVNIIRCCIHFDRRVAVHQ